MSKLWEVDPETRSKLQIIQKTNGNDRCCDCGAPSPQWASPKFGTFICLNCAGIHRGLGVHISFVRSITMDAFKLAEIQRMENGGNEPWKQFFDAHSLTLAEGRTFEDSTVKERYSGEVGEEWKERLSAKIEGREYVPVPKTEVKKKSPTDRLPGGGLSRSSTTTPKGFGGDSREPLSRSKSAAGSSSKKEQNEAYFAKMGGLNASRSEGLAPSEGGKYTGFGGGMPVDSSSSRSGGGGGIPGLDDFQSDPVAALTKGFGWFTPTVGRGAKTMNDTYIQPVLAESDLAAQARLAATEVGRNIQTGTRTAADSFNRFVEGNDGPAGGPRRAPGASSASARGFEPERKDFWDSFAAVGEERERQRHGAGSTSGSGAIGTGTMKKNDPPISSPTKPASSAAPKDDGWDDNW
ncbi:ADP-ribosylation factor GTPase-activating protein GCS1 [Nannizzia gypsea CBS 118893]|uniref:ADP-ribosylation factor GTPase-activating protein GCS1 n=1 Tax=Arthroderma gypseum (strain ATCC MYA-4604 / CBS 118893) TaxID=535722 RepID=E4UT08_ARTGP|nr:ADP-ribosylation factor GTPase-activating protein GCS1 [Nannizzia gypsea CBS 118893]EFR00621.1 ADP-ribosylation factor GTPase-activating protein GCS1 [Nannizzia gypsea CBS 118893]